jgi:hypothetical protein
LFLALEVRGVVEKLLEVLLSLIGQICDPDMVLGMALDFPTPKTPMSAPRVNI